MQGQNWEVFDNFYYILPPFSVLLLLSADREMFTEWDVSMTECDFPFLFQVDFANRESQLAFYHSMEKTGQDIRDFYEMLAERRHVSMSLFIFLFSSITLQNPFTIIVFLSIQ